MPKLLVKLLIFCFPICAFSQQNISANFQNEPLKTVLQQLETDYSLVFSYSQNLIENQLVTAKFQQEDLANALSLILKNTNLDFDLINETYIVLKVIEKELKTLTLCGKIKDSEGEPMAFSTIFISKNGQGATANEEGFFELESKGDSSDLVEFSFVGFQNKQLKAADLMDCPTIILEMETFSFAEIIIKEYMTQGIEQSEDLNHLVLHPDEIDVVPGLTEADVLQMVEILPGVQSLNESATGLHIRGGTPDQNLILWDGIPIYNSGHFFGMISGFNPFIVDSVKVFRGNFGADYGGRVGGVIDIQSEQEIPEKVKTTIGLNFTNSDASVVVPMFKKKSAFLLSARQSYTNILKSPTFNSLSNQLFNRGRIGIPEENADELDLGLDFSFTDLNAKWWGKIGEKDEISLSVFSIFDQLNYEIIKPDEEGRETDKLKLNNIGWSARWAHQWDSHFSSNAKIVFTDFQNTYDYILVEDDAIVLDATTTQKNSVRDLTVDWTNHWQISAKKQLEFGYQFSDYLVRRDLFWEATSSESFVNNHRLHTTFLKFQHYFDTKLNFNAGLRYNYYTGLKKNYLEPRFSINYLPAKQWQFRFSLGKYHQFISQITELNGLGFNEQLWAMANKATSHPVVKGDHLMASILFHRPKFQLELEAYYKKLSGLSSLFNPILNEFTRGDQIEGNGTVKGLDVLLKKRWNTYQFWISYSLSEVLYQFESLNEKRPFSAPHNRPHSLHLVQLVNRNNWQFSIAWKYATGKAFTKVEELIEEDDDFFLFYDTNAVNKDRLPNYHRLDASILYKISPKNTWTMTFGLSFLNLYNRKNILNRQFELDAFETEDGEELPFIQTLNQHSLEFTPNLVVRMRW